MTTLRELVTAWGFDIDMASLEAMDEQLGALKEKADGFAVNAKAMADGVANAGARLTIGLTLPIVAAGAAMVKFASDAEETGAKFDTVFAAVQEDADAVAQNLEENFGLSSLAAKTLLSDTGDLLTGFGFLPDAALDISKQVNELAVDLASFTNFEGGATGASQALTKALLGERESVKSLGISILEEDVKRKIQMLRLKGVTFESNRQAKAMATLLIAQEQSKNAIGDFARTSEGFANQVRILKGALVDLAVAFGEEILPVLKPVVAQLIKMARFFARLPDSVQKVVIVMGALAAALGPVLFITGVLAGAALNLTAAWATYGAVMTATVIPAIVSFIAAAGPVILAVAAIAVVLLLVQDLFVFLQGGDSAIGRTIDAIMKMPGAMGDVLRFLLAMAGVIAVAFKVTGEAIGVAMFHAVDISTKAWTKFRDFMTGVWDTLKAGVEVATEFMKKLLSPVVGLIQKLAKVPFLKRAGEFVGGELFPGAPPGAGAPSIPARGPGGGTTRNSTNVTVPVQVTPPVGMTQAEAQALGADIGQEASAVLDQTLRGAQDELAVVE